MSNEYKKFETKRIATYNIAKDIYPVIDQNGDWKEVTGKDAIITSIRNLLMTPLGQYPFDPNYGSLLYKKLFEMADSVTEEEIKYEVKDRIERFESRVKVSNVNIQMSNKTATVDVVLSIQGEQNKTPLSIFMKNLGSNMVPDKESEMSSVWGEQ